MAINLGDINFGLGPDTRRLDNARRQVVQFGQAVNQAARQQGAGARENEAALRRQEKALVDSLNKVLKLNDAIRKSGANPTHFNATTQQINRLVRELTNGRVSALQFQRSMEDITTSMNRTKRAVDAHIDSERRAAEAARIAAQAQKQQMQDTMRLERTLHSATAQVERYNAAVTRAKGSSAMAGAGNSALGTLRGALSSPGLSGLDIQRASQAFQLAMGRNVDALRAFRKEGMHGATPLTEALRRLADVSILLNGPLGGIAARMSLLSTVASKTTFAIAGVVAGIAGATYAFTKLSQSAIEAAKKYERVTQSLNSINEVAGTTAVQLRYLMRESDQTGTVFAQNAQAFARLQAAAAGTNLEGDRTREIFESIIAAGAKLNLSQEDVGGTLKAIEQIMSKGTLQAEELRGQLGDRLPGAFNMMARAIGVSTRELGELMKQGKVTSDALIPFVRELTKTFGVDLNQSIDTVTAAEGRVTNAFLRFNKAADETIGFSRAWKAILNGTAVIVNTLTDNFTKAIAIIKLTGLTLAGLAAPMILNGIIAIGGAIRATTIAMMGLNAAAGRNPFVKLLNLVLSIGGAVAAATIGMQLFGDELNALPTSDLDEMKQGVLDSATALKVAEQASASFRQELISQIEMQKLAAVAADQEALAQLGAARAKAQAAMVYADDMIKNGSLWENLTAGVGYDKAQAELKATEERYKETSKLVQTLTDQVEEARRIAREKGDKGVTPIDPLGGGDELSDSQVRARAKAVREAGQAIADLGAQYAMATMSPASRAFATMQAETNKQIETFRDKLVDAQLPAGTITTLTNQYAEALQRVNEQSYAQANMPNIWEKFADIIGGGIDEAMMKFLDNIIAGQDALTDLKDIAKAVAVDMLKTFTQLAVLNPLKNLIFGGNYASGGPYQTASYGGGGGIGGFLSSLFGGLVGGGGLPTGGTSGFYPGINGPRLAGGASFTIPGGGIGRGMDSQLVQFWGSPGEEVTVNKRGHGSGSGEGTVIHYTQQVYGTGNEEIARISKASALEVVDAYDKGSTRRTANNMAKARFQRMPGAR